MTKIIETDRQYGTQELARRIAETTDWEFLDKINFELYKGCKMTRGQRNNNPGNIRLSSQTFAGEIKGADKVFKTFSTMAYGYRALIRILINYQELHGCNTIRKIINRWAPDNENATSEYVKFVCSDTGYMADEAIDTHKKDVAVKLARAISKMECGGWHDTTEAMKGFDLL